MPKLKIKHPCNDCPYRRNATPGWLGSRSLVSQEVTNDQCQHFVNGALADYASNEQGEEYHLPCHKTIDYTDPNWMETQYPDSALCAGALIFVANNFKRPRDPQRAEWVSAVEPDPNVFRYPWEFWEHHGGDLSAMDPLDKFVMERSCEQLCQCSQRPDPIYPGTHHSTECPLHRDNALARLRREQ